MHTLFENNVRSFVGNEQRQRLCRSYTNELFNSLNERYKPRTHQLVSASVQPSRSVAVVRAWAVWRLRVGLGRPTAPHWRGVPASPPLHFKHVLLSLYSEAMCDYLTSN